MWLLCRERLFWGRRFAMSWSRPLLGRSSSPAKTAFHWDDPVARAQTASGQINLNTGLAPLPSHPRGGIVDLHSQLFRRLRGEPQAPIYVISSFQRGITLKIVF